MTSTPSAQPSEELIERVAVQLSMADPDERGLPPGAGMREFYRDLAKAALAIAYPAAYRAGERAGREAGDGVVSEIAAERRRQIQEEGFGSSHDDPQTNGALARAAAAYAAQAGGLDGIKLWPPALGWRLWWKPKTPRRDLIRAAALIIAEVERLDRSTPPTKEPSNG